MLYSLSVTFLAAKSSRHLAVARVASICAKRAALSTLEVTVGIICRHGRTEKKRNDVRLDRCELLTTIVD